MKKPALVFLCVLALIGTTGCRNTGNKTAPVDEESGIEEVVDDPDVDECLIDNPDGEDTDFADYAWDGTVGTDDVTVWAYIRKSDGLCAGSIHWDTEDYMVLGHLFENNYFQMTVYDRCREKGVMMGYIAEDGSFSGDWSNFQGDDRSVAMHPIGRPKTASNPLLRFHSDFEDFKVASAYIRVETDGSTWILNLVSGEKPDMSFFIETPYGETFGNLAPDYSSLESIKYQDYTLNYDYSQNERLVFEFFDTFVDVTIKWIGEGDGYRQAEATGSGFYILDTHYEEHPAYWQDEESEDEETEE